MVDGGVEVPRVLHLERYDRTPRTLVRLSRRNIMLRDGHQCQYCGRKPAMRRGCNIDHVVPRSRGGRDAWENLVTACEPCDLREGSLAARGSGRAAPALAAEAALDAGDAEILLGAGNPHPAWGAPS